MDKQSYRERMRHWLAVGLREGLTFRALAKRAGCNERTLRAWNKKFRRESAQRATADREEDAFVELVEQSHASANRIEIVVDGHRRIVLDGSAIVEALVRIVTAIERC